MTKEKLYIIKIGGNILDDDQRLENFIDEFSQIQSKKILIHGGGKLATQLAEKLGIKQEMIDGRRITDAETLKIATMVYAGYCNKSIVAQLQAKEVNAIGLSGADANIIQAEIRSKEKIDYGFVGDLTFKSIQNRYIVSFLENDLVPVFCAITHDKKGQLLNTNADTITQMIASSLSHLYEVNLFYCFEKQGVLQNAEDENSLITELNYQSYKELKNNEVIHSGMLPKLENAFKSVQYGVENVFIIKEDNLLNHINQKNAKATRII